MRDVNRVILLGRLGANPILRYTKNGIPVAHLSLATSKRTHVDANTGLDSKNKENESISHSNELDLSSVSSLQDNTDLDSYENNENQELNSISYPKEYKEETQWHQIICWGKQAETASFYLKKGHAIYIEGNLKTHSYENKSGESKITVEIHAEMLSFLGKAKLDTASV